MKRWKRAVIAVLAILCLHLLTGQRAYAEEGGETLKVYVPLMNDSGFVTYENGEFSGYYVDYLAEVAKYTGWNYEFTAIESYEELDRACELGEYDLMTGIIYSEEYDKDFFEYPKHTVGAKRYVFAVPKDSGLIPDKEYAYLRGVKIGIASKSSGITELEERFRDFCFMNGISCVSDMEKYPAGVNFIHIAPEERAEKQESGEIDGILCSDAFCISQDMYAITTFGMDQIFFVSPNEKADITNRLNSALEKISNFDPEYNDRLYEKYFGSNMEYTMSFNQNEKDYLKKEHVLRVSMIHNYAPYTYINDEGKMAGMVVEVLNNITKETQDGLKFEYVFYETMAEAIEAVQRGECDIYGVSMYSAMLKRDGSEWRSMSYYTDTYTYYRNNTIRENGKERLAVVPEIPSEIKDSILEEECEISIELPGRCLELVENGKKNHTLMLSRTGDYYKSYYGYSDLTAYPVESGEVMFCFAYNKEVEQEAVSIIDKCLLGVETEQLDDYITKVSLFEHKEATIQDYIKSHMEFFALVLAGILLLICTLLVIIVINVVRHSKEIYELLYKDDITGGISYKKFLKEAKHFKGNGSKRLIMYINISSFKYINDVFGYEQGNEVLCEVKRFLENSPQQVLFARIYADRFVAMISFNNEEALRERIRKDFDEFGKICREKFPSFNIWIKAGAYIMEEGDDLQKAVNLANYAVDEIQKLSTSDYIFYDELMHDKVLMQKEIEKDMHGAMENGEFEAFYQPKYNIESKELIGAEALIRWRHPGKGLMPPGHFIPIFEKNQYIIQIDYYIFECVCRLLHSLQQEGGKLFPISSNFSRLHLNRPDFVEKLVRIADKYKVPPEYLEIEITETVATEDFDRLIRAVKQLKEKGFQVSIDDFGSGYSSIQLLYKLPIDVLKFDKAFVNHEEASDLETELLDSIISVSHKNGIKIICEGVETLEQEEYVRNHNYIYVQGFLYSKPMEESEFRKLLAENKKYSVR